MGRDEIFYQSFQRFSNMLNLSAEEINLTSPYKVCLRKDHPYYQELTSKFHAVIAGLPEKIENL